MAASSGDRWAFVACSLLLLAVGASLVAVRAAPDSSLADYFVPNRLVAFGEHDAQWLSRADIHKLIRSSYGRSGVYSNNFMDITEHPAVAGAGPAYNATIPKELQHVDEVKAMIPQLSAANLNRTVVHLSSYFNRYYRSETGVQAAEWIHSQFVSLAGEHAQSLADRGLRVEARFFNHSWAQPSVVVRIPGTHPDPRVRDEVVILGAHEDSINHESADPADRSPGADDDASGIALVLEVFRALVSSPKFSPARTLEFHSYSAEEEGLLGSQDVAADYYQRGVVVAGMMMIDQAAFLGELNVIGVLTDYVNPDLTQLLRLLVSTYSDLKPQDTRCGYACTDMASWHRYGYPACHEAESILPDTSPNSHTERDTVDKLNFDHSLQLTRVALGYCVELGLFSLP